MRDTIEWIWDLFKALVFGIIGSVLFVSIGTIMALLMIKYIIAPVLVYLNIF